MVKIIAGLGNPGEKYNNTRHNAGFRAIDALADRLGLSWEKNKKINSLIAKNKDIILIKPLTYMNDSGRCLQAVLSYYNLLPKKLGFLKIKDSDLLEALTIIHDDLDLNLGSFKISIDSRSAGHKGVESIISHLKTKKFKRIRIGIKTEPANKIPAEKFVLQKFNSEELKIINNIISDIIKKVFVL
ncbi:aminoacyl-tRNA hydrolase [Candidatus Falkowbacteria bacterium CG_4_9_14_3_um_filter_36_9]|uniref:Peptidyl-tRNA hydrolase n=2 Tax=Candidatus Falkowiibacteriota TaxID=1752728 RepID=A0A1J4T4J1_9BACT|nr:MAG: aminoacyl-tRNA hydrolase [Candidatus Falkowbacteria bacterium CG1_02_37_44]PIV51895.1 MAG: aminoacyl-tRNA hydrolase [Candidatus Falkowbacteria bacterium CG02_land_8_20_14_3_00_36_14]PIX11523.1 MAG: aminoacyl-tRNA hydrolase [Candidatus Falkowbacteria bacterium CG_4_8_14_3_um_filter_36_11]PJA10281.1 MAG: aminoacyl-tRNA hydrolase [Candidatus Falkowbacteria bacterium CG_4_10_14_0_2_um_filter_36_22]PJB19075.1 MAG: aminoacyl-tRNA hydrolase [Candidatus Falkowbacteria bacterium CG_4_9_14_3_um_f